MEKKDKIIKSAIELFGVNGFLATPTSKVSRNAEVSNGTLFHYFPSKDVLIDECYQNCQQKLQAHLSEMLDFKEPLKEIIRGMWFHSIMWSLENYPDFLYMQKYRHSFYFDDFCKKEEHINLFLKVAEKGVKTGLFKKLPYFFLYDLVTAQATSSVYYFKKNPKEISNTIFLDLLFSSVWDGLIIHK
jgi:AcrR family transcriptional regulator